MQKVNILHRVIMVCVAISLVVSTIGAEDEPAIIVDVSIGRDCDGIGVERLVFSIGFIKR